MMSDKDKDNRLVPRSGSGSPDEKSSSESTSHQSSAPETGGLTPLDLLSLPADQSKIVNWLTHKQHASFIEIQQGLGLESSEITRILNILKTAHFVRETL